MKEGWEGREGAGAQGLLPMFNHKQHNSSRSRRRLLKPA